MWLGTGDFGLWRDGLVELKEGHSVDLSGVRPNVCIEAGFALRNHEKNRLIFMFQPNKKHKTVPFDLNTFRYEHFDDTGAIPDKIKPHITAILDGASVGR